MQQSDQLKDLLLPSDRFQYNDKAKQQATDKFWLEIRFPVDSNVT